MRLTPLGVGVLVVAVAGAVVGLVTGTATVTALGIALVVLVGAAAVMVAEVPQVRLDRLASPPEVSRGRAAEVRLHFTSTSRGRPRTMTVIEAVAGVDHITTVGPIPREGSANVAYPVPTSRRGIIIAGPLVVRHLDPFGLVVADRRFGGTCMVRVRPRRLPVRLLPAGRRRELEGPTRERSEGTTAFHQLRPYTPGDDLRRIHWRSTAKHGDLLVKQMVDTSQPELVVLLDNRAEVIGADDFEEAVDIAASLASAAEAEGYPADLVFTADPGLDGDGRRLPDLDRLTAVHTVMGASLAEVADRLRVRGHGLVVVTGEPTGPDLVTLTSLARGASPAFLVSVRRERFSPLVPPRGMRPIACRDAIDFVAQWSERR
ncbi:MAG: DUF58 domain-containing protein [Desertimonas sp.]